MYRQIVDMIDIPHQSLFIEKCYQSYHFVAYLHNKFYIHIFDSIFLFSTNEQVVHGFLCSRSQNSAHLCLK